MRYGNQEQQASKRVRRILRQMLVTHPFYATLALRLELIPDSTIPDTATNGVSFSFNPEWVMGCDTEDIMLNLAHAVTACALKHHTRRGDRDEARWNWASYQTRLPLVRDAGFDFGEGDGLDMSVEKAYRLALDFREGTQEPVAMPGSAEGKSSGGVEMSSSPDSPMSPTNGRGLVLDAPRPEGATDEEHQQALSEMEAEWDVAVQTTSQIAKTYSSGGTSSRGLKETLLASHRGEGVDYRTLLMRFMHDYTKTDYTWLRPNRRHIHMGIYTPALQEQSMARIAVLIDSSASMEDTTLNRIWTDIRDMARELRPTEIVVIHGDTKVQGVETYTVDELPDELDISGRGGTAYQPLFDALEELLPVACVLFYTDLRPAKKSGFGEAPQAPLIWLVDEADHQAMGDPPFGEVITIPTMAMHSH